LLVEVGAKRNFKSADFVMIRILYHVTFFGQSGAFMKLVSANHGALRNIIMVSM